MKKFMISSAVAALLMATPAFAQMMPPPPPGGNYGTPPSMGLGGSYTPPQPMPGMYADPSANMPVMPTMNAGGNYPAPAMQPPMMQNTTMPPMQAMPPMPTTTATPELHSAASSGRGPMLPALAGGVVGIAVGFALGRRMRKPAAVATVPAGL